MAVPISPSVLGSLSAGMKPVHRWAAILSAVHDHARHRRARNCNYRGASYGNGEPHLRHRLPCSRTYVAAHAATHGGHAGNEAGHSSQIIIIIIRFIRDVCRGDLRAATALCMCTATSTWAVGTCRAAGDHLQQHGQQHAGGGPPHCHGHGH